jgi:hypothetical protein
VLDIRLRDIIECRSPYWFLKNFFKIGILHPSVYTLSGSGFSRDSGMNDRGKAAPIKPIK